ncbi:MAG: LegC family aminotransferase [Ignavibacteriaceae bacterium]|nr:LegC family aminotransferase [Ignavibacteriaceae bacterium]
MSDFIPLSVPSIKGNEWKYIKECLDTEWVSSVGNYVDQFEKKIAEYTGTKYAVACINGTSALHVSLLLAGVKPEDEVIVPTLTFIATVNSIKYCGAYPVFMDSDCYYNLNTEKTIEFIIKETEMKKTNISGGNEEWRSYNKRTGRCISAIIPVHIFGNAVWLDDIYKVCKEKNIKIIEDAAESLGTKYSKGKLKGKNTGSIGELGCLSFNGNKIITAGGGGMIITNNKKYAEKAKYLTTQAKDDSVRFIHNEIGFNYRLSNIQAALGVAQLEKLGSYIKIKKNNYDLYKKYIQKIDGLNLAAVPEYAVNNYWMYALQIDKERYGKDKKQLMRHLHDNNIQSRPVWYLNHKQKKYKCCQSFFIEEAEILYQETLNIPCSVNLRKESILKVIEKLNER